MRNICCPSRRKGSCAKYVGAFAIAAVLGIAPHADRGFVLTGGISGPGHVRPAHVRRRCAGAADTSAMRSWRVKQLRSFLDERGIRHNDCFDKQDLIDRAIENVATKPLEKPSGGQGGQPRPADKASGAASAGGGGERSFANFGEVVTVPSRLQEKASMIFFHGFGDSAGGFVRQLPDLLRLPTVKYVLPTAPAAMAGMRSWFSSMPGMSPTSGVSGGDGAAAESIDYAHHLIRQEVALGRPVFVGGFSQGGSVAVQAALSFPDAPLAGCIAASTFLGTSGDSLRIADANRRLPVLCVHGEADPAVPVTSGNALVADLRNRGISCDFKTYPGMAHAYCPQEAADVRDFVERRLLLAGGKDRLRSLSARELKALLVDLQVNIAGCVDKDDLLERASSVIP
eukprot:TRINITY_DN41534_c0_g1_i2.p1 TRINITY_DN41534_c0_g1~~TRINITY_DN41534_c0_g1_i2.p1  ORF type:complete len:399 (-),score=86.58 TRINITY_DN41534_c0_g1_i2:182-1378(-)